MSIFELAMKLEADGRAYYLEHAERQDHSGLKKILLELADDELKHFNLFKSMRDGASVGPNNIKGTTVTQTALNIFEQLKANADSESFSSDTRAIWEHALEVEKHSEDFYRQKAAEVEDPAQKETWMKIADEEHRHWLLIQSVCEFLDEPERYLADAEWTSLDDK